MPQKLRMTLLTVIAVLIGFCCLVSVSYAYYAINPIIVSSKVTLPRTGTVVALFEKKALRLAGEYAKPISDLNALSFATHQNRIFITNNTDKRATYKVYLVPTKNSTVPIETMKYVIHDTKNEKPAYGTAVALSSDVVNSERQVLITKNGYTPGEHAYLLGDSFMTFPNKTTALDLYLWVGTNEVVANATKDGIFEGVILIVKE